MRFVRLWLMAVFIVFVVLVLTFLVIGPLATYGEY
jgi:hypothetical protein